jgi:glycosyltransferase involved in cell wall biosynthesis
LADRANRPLRVAVYGEFNYRRDESGLSSDQSFVLFVARLSRFVERLVIVGRLDPSPGGTFHRLPGDFKFVALPDYPSLASMAKAMGATLASIPTLWRSLDDVDAVWLLGPNPLSIVFALLAWIRRRRVVLGVRQDIVALTRSRYGRGANFAAAVLLEKTWRLISRLTTVTTVGPDLESKYRGARRVIPFLVSLVEEADLVSAKQAAERDYGGELVILSVGRLEPQKNPLLLAQILAELQSRNVSCRLVVCGSGSMEDELAAELERLGVADRAELCGYVPVDGALQQAYRQSHLFLHVSWTEGFPQVLLEAFAAGLPTLATDVGGIRDWVSEAALLVPPGDAAGAADGVQRLASDPQLRARLVERALDTAREHTIDAECGRILGALRGDA